MDDLEKKKIKILLIGYGKMGQTIHRIAQDYGCEVIGMLNQPTPESDLKSMNADVAIEFTQPDQAIENISKCFEANLPIVVGTTGWYDQYQVVKNKTLAANQKLFTATNFGFGVNLFLAFNHKIAEIMNRFPEYRVNLHEIHHCEKQDAPSGTAITLAETIIANLDKYQKWQLQTVEQTPSDILPISFERIHLEAGQHRIAYSSSDDVITLNHTSRSREGFAKGALLAAKWLVAQKSGVYGMQDMLQL